VARRDGRLRVCIDARTSTGAAGGVAQVIAGLAAGLSAIDDGDERYSYLVHHGADGWIAPYVGNADLLHVESPQAGRTARLRDVKALHWLWHHVSPLAGPRTVKLARSDGTIERERIDVMHFTFQTAFVTEVPNIYQPWDLQHVHLPQFFTPRDRLARDVVFRTFCEQADLVATASSWVKEDVADHLDVPREKIAVVPAAPAPAAFEQPTRDDIEATCRRLALPDVFLFYPSQTWPHKNHLRLVDAVARLREAGVDVFVVCSGFQNSFFGQIERAIRGQGLSQQIRFVGFVSDVELQSLYRLARGVILPTRFEGWGMPLLEAFAAGAPVACSAVTSLPEQAGEAAILFDADSVDDIAAAMRRLWADEALRRDLVARGRERVKEFTWERAARTYRAHYRRLGGRPLSSEDDALIARSFAA
jgi:glycosyltransferase involved in cell wall biosynthesis